MKQTLTFAVMHFCIAFSLAYLLTGDVIIGSLVAMTEPAINTVAFYFHEKVWQTRRLFRLQWQQPRLKTTSFAVVHFGVAFSVAYLMTGDLITGGLLAILEPCINTIVFHFHDKFWRNRTPQPTEHGLCGHHHALLTHSQSELASVDKSTAPH